MKSVKDWEEQQAAITPRPEDQVISFLNERLGQIDNLRKLREDISSDVFEEWQSSVNTILRRTFGEKSPESTKFEEISYAPSVIKMGGDNDEAFSRAYQQGLDRSQGTNQKCYYYTSIFGYARFGTSSKKGRYKHKCKSGI